MDDSFKTFIKIVTDKFNFKELEIIITEIDQQVPNKFKNWLIPKERKEIIIKLLTLSIEKLSTLM